jgi:D-ribose pyranase
MKKHGIFNKELMTAIADLGHTEIIVIGDAGVPVADSSKKIDLAISEDLPTIAQVLDLVMDELIFERVVVAEEQKLYNPVHFENVSRLAHERYDTMEIETLAHEEFMATYLPNAKFIVRTGDLMPWGNVVLQAGIDAKVWFQKDGCSVPDYYEERASYDN